MHSSIIQGFALFNLLFLQVYLSLERIGTHFVRQEVSLTCVLGFRGSGTPMLFGNAISGSRFELCEHLLIGFGGLGIGV